MDKPESRHEYGPESLSPDPQEPESSGPSPSWARVPESRTAHTAGLPKFKQARAITAIKSPMTFPNLSLTKTAP